MLLARDNATVYEIDPTSLAVSRRIQLGSQAISMRLSRGGDALWILLRDPASLVEVPLREFRPGRRVRLATPPDTFELSRETGDACVVTRNDHSVTQVSLDKGSVTRNIVSTVEPAALHTIPDEPVFGPGVALAICGKRAQAKVKPFPMQKVPDAREPVRKPGGGLRHRRQTCARRQRTADLRGVRAQRNHCRKSIFVFSKTVPTSTENR